MEISMRSWIFNEVDEYLMESMNIQVLIPIHIPIQGSILRIDQSEVLFVKLPRVIFGDPGGSTPPNEHLHTTFAYSKIKTSTDSTVNSWGISPLVENSTVKIK